MCMHVTVQPEKCEPRTEVLTLDSGESFVSLRLGDATVILPGRDTDAMLYINALQEALVQASCEVFHRMRQHGAPDAVGVADTVTA